VSTPPYPSTRRRPTSRCERWRPASARWSAPSPTRGCRLRLDDGTLALSELEVIEPGIYLDVVPENAGHFADAVLAVL